jgi:hypothetical protein
MNKSQILTAVIAIYGAVLSTVTILRQYFSDRVKVTFTVSKNMQMVGHPKYRGMTLTVLTVTNVGKRPVTIRTFGTVPLYPHLGLVAVNTTPQLPCELTEGKFVSSYWEQDDIDFSEIDYWATWDSHGNIHKCQEASRFRHWKSVRQQKREWRKNKGKKKAEPSKDRTLGEGA